MTRLFDVLRGFRVPLAVAALVAVTSCGRVPQAGDSNSYLVITSLVGASGASPSKLTSTVDSDVVTFVSQSVGGQTVSVPTYFPDPGQATFSLVMRDPTNTSPSPVNFITISRYHVSYIRSDGRNTQGVDVPYAFDGAATTTVNSTGGTAAFTLVRVQAKQEAPLQALGAGGGSGVISMLAQVTFYGSDQAGHDVSVTGTIGVDFANWGDPGSGN
jgi:hypothetical protein